MVKLILYINCFIFIFFNRSLATYNKYGPKILSLIKDNTAILVIILFSILFITKAEDEPDNGVLLKEHFELFNNALDNDALISLKNQTYFNEVGKSSFYGKKFHGRKTSSGQRFDMHKFTAAHKDLPFGTIVKVTNVFSNKSSLAIINDRGPFVKNRIIDVSRGIAQKIDAMGVAKVLIEGINTDCPQDSLEFANKFIAFSLINDISFVEPTDINFLKESDDFSEIASEMHELQEINPKINYCLLVSTDDYFSSKFERKYYLGIVPERFQFANTL